MSDELEEILAADVPGGEYVLCHDAGVLDAIAILVNGSKYTPDITMSEIADLIGIVRPNPYHHDESVYPSRLIDSVVTSINDADYRVQRVEAIRDFTEEYRA